MSIVSTIIEVVKTIVDIVKKFKKLSTFYITTIFYDGGFFMSIYFQLV